MRRLVCSGNGDPLLAWEKGVGYVGREGGREVTNNARQPEVYIVNAPPKGGDIIHQVSTNERINRAFVYVSL